jgi:predicted transposase YdaD
MIDDIIRETPAYKEMTKEAREEGLEEGLQALRQTLLNVVQARFPKAIRLAKKQIAVIDDPDILSKLIVQMSTAQSIEEAKQQLLAVDEDEEE